MVFPTDELALGPATFGRRKGTEGIIWHTTEASDASRASALGTVRWQLSNPGSYNFIIYDGGILLTVPYLEASGGVNTGGSAWAPHRYPFLKANLSPAAYADPNAYLMNVSFSGKTAVFRDRGIPDNMIQTAKKLSAWAEATFGRKMFHSGHLHWQTNRSDPSLRVLSLITGEPEDMQFWKPVQEDWTTKTGARFWDGNGNEKVFTSPDRVRSIAESSDGNYRLVKYGTNELLVMERAGLTPITGTRIPAPGSYGFPPPETIIKEVGIKPESYAALQQQGVTALKNIGIRANADAEALAAKKP